MIRAPFTLGRISMTWQDDLGIYTIRRARAKSSVSNQRWTPFPYGLSFLSAEGP